MLSVLPFFHPFFVSFSFTCCSSVRIMCQAVGVGEGVGQREGHRLWCGTADSKAVNCDGGKI